jgi:glycosyltransferase involved in cell wall biosynthesis
MKQLEISVTIPVYNAAAYVHQAVESALSQPQTVEVVLVEDSSSDNSWEVCQQLASRNANVRLYRHPDDKNHGCSASRSLAVKKSACEYIAFLDADDYYLPNRFDRAERLFFSDPSLEGVYEAIAMHVENDDSLMRWQVAGRSNASLHTMKKRVAPDELFSALVSGKAGSFSIDGLVIKKSVFRKTGYFDEDLPLHMDDVFFIKAAALSKLVPGSLDEPVAMWRVHNHNRISAPRPKNSIYKYKLRYWFTLWQWSRTHLQQEQQDFLLQAMIHEAMYKTRFNRPIPRRFYGLQKRIQLLLLPLAYPGMLTQQVYWRSFLPGFAMALNKQRS